MHNSEDDTIHGISPRHDSLSRVMGEEAEGPPPPTHGPRHDSLSAVMGDPPDYGNRRTAEQVQNHLTSSPAPHAPAPTGYWRHDSLSGILGDYYVASGEPDIPAWQEGYRWTWDGDFWRFGPRVDEERPPLLHPSSFFLHPFQEAHFNPAEPRDWRGRWTTGGAGGPTGGSPAVGGSGPATSEPLIRPAPPTASSRGESSRPFTKSASQPERRLLWRTAVGSVSRNCSPATWFFARRSMIRWRGGSQGHRASLPQSPAATSGTAL